jgi:O-acetyl-ADP-ribose deacetylase (regulator of RNase III)
MEILVRSGSLTEGSETVLVNASNTHVSLGSGVSAAIAASCGPGYQATISAALAARFGGPMAPGDVLVTDAGTHPRARWVAHVAVMDYRPGSPEGATPTLPRIERACRSLWSTLESLPDDALSVAMVALGAGVGGLGVRSPTRIACETLRAHARETPASRIARVVFYGYTMLEHANVADEVKRHLPWARIQS